ncbi:hypothetical protein ABPG75_002608 [Micractinium tetrahymenae]
MPRHSSRHGPLNLQTTDNGATSISYAIGDSYVGTFYAQPGVLLIEIGNYTSWQCAPQFGPGAYTGVINFRTLNLDGRETSRGTKCEVGRIKLSAGILQFANSETACPTQLDGNPALATFTRLPPAAGTMQPSPSAAALEPAMWPPQFKKAARLLRRRRMQADNCFALQLGAGLNRLGPATAWH